MKKDNLLNSVGNIDPKYVDEAEKSTNEAIAKKNSKKVINIARLRWGLATAACIALAVILVFVINPINKEDPNGGTNVAQNTNTPVPVAKLTSTPHPTLFIDPANLPTNEPLIKIPTKGPTQPVAPTQPADPIYFTTAVASLTDGYVRKSTDTGNLTAEMKEIIADYAWKLLMADVNANKGNRMVSPYSALSALALVANGMQGESLKQLEAYLGADILSLNRGLYAYSDFLKSVGTSKFNIANSIWTDNTPDNFKANPDFLQTNADWYDSQVYSAKLSDEKTVKAINEWCNKNTNGMIPELLDSLPDDALMVLINAIAFEAEWKEQYSDSGVNKGNFTNANGTKSKVDFLTANEKTFLYDGTGKEIGFVKEYSGDRYSFVGILPSEGETTAEFISGISGKRWLEMWNGRKSDSIMVRLPEFKCEATSPIKQYLMDAGVTAMFMGEGYDKTDFAPLGSSELGDLYVGDIFQKTFIDVNRKGTKAAAVTGVIEILTTAVVEKLEFNRPFVYAIVDNVTGLPVFVGAVNNL